MTVRIDKSAITRAILEAEIPALAKEQAAELVEAWVDRWLEHDSRWTVEAVEMPFYLWLDDERTSLCVGVSDLRARDEKGRFHGEWKSASPPKPRSRYNEEVWAQELLNGVQLAVYALAQREGFFLLKDGTWLESHEASPRMCVRACVKSSPPAFWPSDGAVFEATFDDGDLARVKAALRAEAAAIHARKRTGALPWMYVGHQCTNKFGRLCRFHEDCLKGRIPEFGSQFSTTDPGRQALVALLEKEAAGKDVVVLSASAYQNAQQCAELYRRENMTGAGKEESYALDVGTGMHAGVAEFYRQLKETQNDVAK